MRPSVWCVIHDDWGVVAVTTTKDGAERLQRLYDEQASRHCHKVECRAIIDDDYVQDLESAWAKSQRRQT